MIDYLSPRDSLEAEKFLKYDESMKHEELMKYVESMKHEEFMKYVGSMKHKKFMKYDGSMKHKKFMKYDEYMKLKEFMKYDESIKHEEFMKYLHHWSQQQSEIPSKVPNTIIDNQTHHYVNDRRCLSIDLNILATVARYGVVPLLQSDDGINLITNPGFQEWAIPTFDDDDHDHDTGEHRFSTDDLIAALPESQPWCRLKQGLYNPASVGAAILDKNLLVKIATGLDPRFLCAILRHWLPQRIATCTKAQPPLIPLGPNSILRCARKGYEERDGAGYVQVDSQGYTVITNPYQIYPRRLWDLEANRVVPSYLVFENRLHTNSESNFPHFIAISHSWREGSELALLLTPINCFAWPVPIPTDYNPDILRWELLTKFPNIKYCWLDVLCLRQAEIRPEPPGFLQDPILEALGLGIDYVGDMRSQELLIDVPTIGNIYNKSKLIYRFFNGLGQPVRLDCWDCPRHWMNRAWTLQEYYPLKTLDGGFYDYNVGLGKKKDFMILNYISKLSAAFKNIEPGRNFLNQTVCRRGVTKRMREFIAELSNVVKETSVIALAVEMGKRHATNEVDKIAGLSYLLRFPSLPTYSAKAPISEAWYKCLLNMSDSLLAELFWCCPIVTSRASCLFSRWVQWVPTWENLLLCPPSFVPYSLSATPTPPTHAPPTLPALSPLSVPPAPPVSPSPMLANGLFFSPRDSQDKILQWPVHCLWVRYIQHVTESDYTFLTMSLSKGSSLVTRRKFFISHDNVFLTTSQMKIDLSLERGRTRSQSCRLRTSHVLVTLNPREYPCSVWVLLKVYRIIDGPMKEFLDAQHAALSENILLYCEKISVLRTDEDVTQNGASNLGGGILQLSLGNTPQEATVIFKGETPMILWPPHDKFERESPLSEGIRPIHW